MEGENDINARWNKIFFDESIIIITQSTTYMYQTYLGIVKL